MADKGVAELEALGVFVHGSLFAYHSLGVVYNYRARRFGWTLFHAVAAAVDLAAARTHSRAAKREREKFAEVVRFPAAVSTSNIIESLRAKADEIESALRGDDFEPAPV